MLSLADIVQGFEFPLVAVLIPRVAAGDDFDFAPAGAFGVYQRDGLPEILFCKEGAVGISLLRVMAGFNGGAIGNLGIRKAVDDILSLVTSSSLYEVIFMITYRL